ncbi:MAG TPA: hypothetical protein PLO40_12285 [Spirochaetota bacterium]|nr:hypothetical protein [Spirochaetota bacterium]
MIVTHIEKVDGKVIVPLEDWNMIIAKLEKIGGVKVEENKSKKRKNLRFLNAIGKIDIDEKSVDDLRDISRV